MLYAVHRVKALFILHHCSSLRPHHINVISLCDVTKIRAGFLGVKSSAWPYDIFTKSGQWVCFVYDIVNNARTFALENSAWRWRVNGKLWRAQHPQSSQSRKDTVTGMLHKCRTTTMHNWVSPLIQVKQKKQKLSKLRSSKILLMICFF